MNWKNRVTELLDCEYPILQGALSAFGNWKFAAAVSETGAHGCITAAVSKTPEKLREDIRRCRDATDKPFSVNISVGNCPHIDEMLDVILEEGVPAVETAVYNADNYGKRIKEAGRVWIHKAATVKHCLHAAEHGADAVIIVGLEGIGYKNMNQLTTILSGIEACKRIKVPVILAGGIGDGRGLLTALSTGAEGIMMGTRLMATEESPVPEKFKLQMVSVTADHPKIRYECLNMPDLKEYEDVMKLRGTIPMEDWLPRLERVMLKHSDWKDAVRMWETPVEKLAGLQSMAVQFIKGIQPVSEVIKGIVEEAEEILRIKFRPMIEV